MESVFLPVPHADFQDATSSQGRKARGIPVWDVGPILVNGPTGEELRFLLRWRKV